MQFRDDNPFRGHDVIFDSNTSPPFDPPPLRAASAPHLLALFLIALTSLLSQLYLRRISEFENTFPVKTR
jgi:hypothetical protein